MSSQDAELDASTVVPRYSSLFVQTSLDTYFGGGPLSLRVVAGLVLAEGA